MTILFDSNPLSQKSQVQLVEFKNLIAPFSIFALHCDLVVGIHYTQQHAYVDVGVASRGAATRVWPSI